MAKALYGHLAHPDLRTHAEVQRLRRRVAELQQRVEELELERDLLIAGHEARSPGELTGVG